MTDSNKVGVQVSPHRCGTVAVALALGLSAGGWSQAQANALASVVLDITNLVWYQHEGIGPIDPGGADRALYAYSATDKVKLGTLSLAQFPSAPADQGTIVAGSAGGATVTRGLADVSVPLNPAPACSGPDCSRLGYADNDFSSLPSVAAIDKGYAYIDAMLSNAAFGFGVSSEGATATDPGAHLGMRAELSQVDAGAGQAVSGGQSFALTSTATVTSMEDVFTYFAVTYALHAVAVTDGAGTAGPISAEARWRFSIEVAGSTFTPAELNGSLAVAGGEVASGRVDATKTIYSTDATASNLYRLLKDQEQNLTLVAGVSVGAAASAANPTDVPVPGTVALIFAGGLAGGALRRRSPFGPQRG